MSWDRQITIKSEHELEIMRTAGRINAEALAAVHKILQPGVTTADLNAAAEEVMKKYGVYSPFKNYGGPIPFPASTTISINEELVHGIPGDRQVEEGQIVSIDVGVFYKGYYGDAARSMACGTVDRSRQRLLDTTDLALSRAIRAARTGNCLRDIGVAVEKTCSVEGFGVVRDFVGHGIGTEMHEEPQIANFDTGERGPRLKSGMVLAIEPMVNLGTERVKVLKDRWTAVTADGKPSAHFEHSVVVREDGGEILSGSDACVWGRREG